MHIYVFIWINHHDCRWQHHPNDCSHIGNHAVWVGELLHFIQMDVRLFDLKIMLAWCTLKVATLEREAGEMVRHNWGLGYARFLDKPMYFYVCTYTYIYTYYIIYITHTYIYIIHLHIYKVYKYNFCVLLYDLVWNFMAFYTLFGYHGHTKWRCQVVGFVSLAQLYIDNRYQTVYWMFKLVIYPCYHFSWCRKSTLLMGTSPDC